MGVGAPEAPAAAPHVPVGQVIDEFADRVGGAQWLIRYRGVGGVELVERRIGGEETEGVPQRRERLTHGGVDRAQSGPGRRPGRALGEHPPAQRVGAASIEHLPGIDDVAQGLTHLLTGLVHDVAETEHVLVGLSAKDESVHRQEGVEPATSLVNRLGDQLSGELHRLRRARHVGL